MTLVATQVKRRRGTNDENDAFAGAEGEITVDLTNKELRVHSGNNKFGGYRIGRLTDRQMGFESVPQTIFLENTSNGGLKLLAGSKVIIPNGSGVYNVRQITSDISLGQQLYNNAEMPIVFAEGSGLLSATGEDSGTTTPTASQSYKVFYNTSENKCYFDGTNGWIQCSLPFARASRNSTVGFYRIDRIYNGHGYIGNTYFLLTNLGLILPNGQNKDGTFKNLLRYTTAVKRTSRTWSTSLNQVLYTDGDTIGIVDDYIESETMPTNNKYTLWYKPSEHIMRMNGTSTTYTKESDWSITNAIPIVWFETGQALKPLKMKNIFTPLDKNDTEFIGHQAMPSDKYIELTLGASGATYTAPENGYFIIKATANTSGGFVVISNENIQLATNPIAINAGGGVQSFLPVKKGDVVYVWYGNITVVHFRFIYANGSK